MNLSVTFSFSENLLIFVLISLRFGNIMKYLLRSYSSREPFSKSECANIVRATLKVEVALNSLVNGLKDSLSDKMSYDNI